MYAEELQYQAAQIVADYQGTETWRIVASIGSEGRNTDRFTLLIHPNGLLYHIQGDTSDQVLNGLRDRMDADWKRIPKPEPAF